MKAIAVLSFVVGMTCAAVGQDQVNGRVLVDPDFGLTFVAPEGFDAEMVGQTPEGLVMITVSTTNPSLPAFDPSGDLCDIAFQYDPAFGQGDQAWVNALVDGTGFYERMAEEVIVPGTVESSAHFTHRGASAHQFYGQHELGGPFAVFAIPSPEGFVLVTCVSAKPVSDWTLIDPVIEALTIPGQPRDHLMASGACDADLAGLREELERSAAAPFSGSAIAALDAERERIAAQCGGVDADALMDNALADAGYDGRYRASRFDALAQIGSDLLTEEQHGALDGGRQEVVATSDEATGERYLRYMHFIVGLRSLDQ